MKKCVILAVAVAMFFFITGIITPIKSFAEEKQETLSGKSYNLDEKDAYNLSKGQEVSDIAKRFYVKGDISSVGIQNGFVSYAVKSGNLKLMIDDQFGKALYEPSASTDWHIITDKGNTVDGTILTERIGSGAIIVQTSKDGKAWINNITETDIYNEMDTINKREINGETIDAFYETTNVQRANGCYYRVIVAYKIQKEIEPSKILLWDKKNYDTKERVEIYQFYVYDPSVDKTETLDIKHAYEFSEVNRVDSQDGFKNPQPLKADDPHIGWNVGKFYVSGYTARKDGDVPVFLKVPGDRVALWFNLEQELNKCNGQTDIKVNYTSSGSDIYFGTPTIEKFGRGALIIRRKGYQNNKERQIYTNYLEASATVGANTRVDLFEEGDYEVALDYQLHYDKPFVFGTKTPKTLAYRIFFKFKVRNGDISAFIRDVDTDQFITNANVAEHGFYIDLAQSQYLDVTIKREVLSESLDGLVEDTKFSGVAKENRNYTDEGLYTVTVKNHETGDSIQKKVYVGNRDIMIAHMKTGESLSEINEQIATGAHINESGDIIKPVSPEEKETAEAASMAMAETIEGGTSNDKNNLMTKIIVVAAIIAAILITIGITIKRRSDKRKKVITKVVENDNNDEEGEA